MILWYHANREVSILVHSWKDLSTCDVINIKQFLEYINL